MRSTATMTDYLGGKRMDKPLRCPYCDQLFADAKTDDITVSKSTESADIIRLCNRCKNKYSINMK